MSPRRFSRRTYMIVASGRSALTFNAAMSASSASTTIRSAFLLTLSPTVNCQDILAFLKARLGCERARAGIDQTLRASWVFFSCLGVVAPRRTERARLMHKCAMVSRPQRSWRHYTPDSDRPISVNAMSEDDLRAIHQFVRSLGPAGEPAPQALPPGQQPDTPTVDWPISTR